MAFAPYQRAVRCSGHAQPGAKVLLAYLDANVAGASNGGIYVCRRIRGARNLSLHGEGRACDLSVRSIAAGNTIIALLRPVVGRLGIQCLIFNRRIYSAKEPNGKYYSGVNPHRDHVHIELGWPAALRLTMATVRAVLTGKVPAGKPATGNTDRGPAGAFPLPKGHWYGPNDGSVKSHSGYRVADRLAIQAIQREIGAPQTGIFDAATKAKSSAWKKANHQKSDPLVGLATWNLMKLR